jgi:hypothetical protein
LYQSAEVDWEKVPAGANLDAAARVVPFFALRVLALVLTPRSPIEPGEDEVKVELTPGRAGLRVHRPGGFADKELDVATLSLSNINRKHSLTYFRCLGLAALNPRHLETDLKGGAKVGKK